MQQKESKEETIEATNDENVEDDLLHSPLKFDGNVGNDSRETEDFIAESDETTFEQEDGMLSKNKKRTALIKHWDLEEANDEQAEIEGSDLVINETAHSINYIKMPIPKPPCCLLRKQTNCSNDITRRYVR